MNAPMRWRAAQYRENNAIAMAGLNLAIHDERPAPLLERPLTGCYRPRKSGRKLMKNMAWKVFLTAAILTPVAVTAQPRPGNPTTATVIPKEDFDKIRATEMERGRDEN